MSRNIFKLYAKIFQYLSATLRLSSFVFVLLMTQLKTSHDIQLLLYLRFFMTFFLQLLLGLFCTLRHRKTLFLLTFLTACSLSQLFNVPQVLLVLFFLRLRVQIKQLQLLKCQVGCLTSHLECFFPQIRFICIFEIFCCKFIFFA